MNTKTQTASQQGSLLDEPLAPPAEVTAAPTALEQITASRTLVDKAKAFAVTEQTYAQGVEVLRDLRGAFKKLEEERFSITRTIDASKERVMAFFRPATNAIEEAGNILKGKINAYDAEQQRIADEARRKAEAQAAAERAELERKAKLERDAAEARAKAQREEAERQRREQEEQQRREREAREAQEREAQKQRDAAAAALRAQQEAEAARKRGDEEAARKAEADKLAAQKAADDAEAARNAAALQQQQAATAAADASKAAATSERKADNIEARGAERAEGLEMQAVSTVAAVVDSGVQKVGGVARKMVWKYRIKDETKIGRQFLVIDESKIAKIVKAMGKDAEATVGGIECYQENDIAVRAAK